ncbi:MAG: heme ABC transporter ATP-binding protein [Litoreibacter sp.]|nr:heme ABC transporter ATP-binding protein [Litoreibacter sp.]
MINAQNVSLTLSGKKILKDVSLTLAPGEILALCGPNGAGKSTLLSCLSGEHETCCHAVDYFGTPLNAMSSANLARRRVVLEQSPSLSADFLVSELIELSAPIDLAPDDLNRLVADTVSEIGFAGMLDKPVAALSGGQRHRAHFARVLVQLRANQLLGHECFFFLDEPTASLDIAHQITLLNLARQLAAEGTGILLVLHDLNLAAAFADRVVMLKEGRLVEEGLPQDVFTNQVLSSIYDTRILVQSLANGQTMIQPELVLR